MAEWDIASVRKYSQSYNGDFDATREEGRCPAPAGRKKTPFQKEWRRARPQTIKRAWCLSENPGMSSRRDHEAEQLPNGTPTNDSHIHRPPLQKWVLDFEFETSCRVDSNGIPTSVMLKAIACAATSVHDFFRLSDNLLHTIAILMPNSGEK